MGGAGLKFALGFICLWAVLFSVPKGLAQSEESKLKPGPVFFNEIAWRGSSISTADEWIELYNDSEEIVDLAGWTIFDEAKSKEMIMIDKGKIAPKGYFLIANNAKDYQFTKGQSMLNIDPDYIDSSLSLNNNELNIVLKKGENNVDWVGNGEKSFFNNLVCSHDDLLKYSSNNCKDDKEYHSLERLNYEKGELSENWRSTKVRSDPDTLDTCDLPEPECEPYLDFGNPQNSGAPKISNAKLSKDVFIAKAKNQYRITFDIEDFPDDLLNVHLEVHNDVDLIEKINLSASGQTVNLKYDFCPILILNVTDEVGLNDSYEFEVKCSFMNNLLRISEVLPHPKKRDWNKDGKQSISDEWIELYNGSEDAMLLDGWALRDSSGKIFLLDGLNIKPKGYLILFKSDTKISLNDDGDTLQLINPAGAIESQVIIPASKKYEDISYVLNRKSWQWTTTPTPGAQNTYQLLPEEATTPQADRKSDAKPRIAKKTKSQDIIEEKEIVKKIITTTVIKKINRKRLTRDAIRSFVLGAKYTRDSFPPTLIRIEYLLYFFGFVAFIMLVYCYEICRRE